MATKSTRPKDLLQRYDVWEPDTDKHDYQWKLRLLQSLWREEQGFPVGEHRGRPSGNRVAMPEAVETLVNYLTQPIRAVATREVERLKRQGALLDERRLYDNLLSSQPLCFNLFGELTKDLNLASQVLSDMSKGRVSQVTAIKFEWSPRRSDLRYLGDKTAFDVYVTYQNAKDPRGFLGIEVKYHENLEEKKDPNYYHTHRTRYDEVAACMGCFHEEHLDTLRQATRRRVDGLQQMWRDHLLMGAHRKVDGFDDACSVLLYPAVNTTCEAAVAAYQQCLSDVRTFEAWTLETFVSSLRKYTDDEWVRRFNDRYLALSRLPV